MREISLTARTSFNAAHTEEIPVVLVTITHADLSAPIRLSSDPTERLSIDPLRYGTISRGETYEFVVMSALLPDDKDGAPPQASLVFANIMAGKDGEVELGLAASFAEVARSFQTPASVTIEVVLASSPDDVEWRCTDMRTVSAEYNAERLTVPLSREIATSEPMPSYTMSKQWFPGLYR